MILCYGNFSQLIHSQTLVIVHFKKYYNNHSLWCEVVPYYCFDLHFLKGNDFEHTFICLLAICVSSLDK